MNCYILGAVTGSSNETREIFETYKLALKDKLNILGTPLETATYNGTNTERFNRAKEFIENSDLVIADMSEKSTGAGIEIGLAYNLSKTILVFAKSGSKISGLLLGIVGEENIIFYENCKDLFNKLNNLTL